MSRLFFSVLYLLVGLSSVDSTDRELRVLSWNVNGVRKFSNLPSELKFLEQHDVILLQETFAREDNELLELRGFLGNHARAVPTDQNRNRWGLSSLFRITTFADGFVERLPSPCDWILPSRWRQPGSPGLIVINLYIPVHSRYA